MANEPSPAGAQQAAAPSGATTNGSTGQSGAPAPQAPEAPKELVIKGDRGQDIRIPIDRATEHIKAGMRVEARMAEVNSRAKDIATFDAFMAKRRENPLLDEAVRYAIANPGIVAQQARGTPPPSAPPPPQGGDDDEGAPAGTPAPNGEVASLKSEISQLTEAVRGLLGKESSREVDTALEREMSKHPWVKGSENASEFVRQHVTASIQLAVANRQPVPSVAQLVTEAASQVQQIIQDTDARRLQDAEARKRLRTTDPARAASSLTPLPKLGKHSFEDGSLAKAISQRLQDLVG